MREPLSTSDGLFHVKRKKKKICGKWSCAIGGNIKYKDARNECYKKRLVMSATLKRCFSFATGNMMKFRNKRAGK